jgi:hypothetical protein
MLLETIYEFQQSKSMTGIVELADSPAASEYITQLLPDDTQLFVALR